MSSNITRELLRAYLDERLPTTEMAHIEKELRINAQLRELLSLVQNERENSHHSLGTIWQQERLTCPTREEINSYLRDLLEPDFKGYIHFHIFKVGCPYCLANLEDLQELQSEASRGESRRERIFESSVGFLREAKE